MEQRMNKDLSSTPNAISRRDFVKLGASAGIGLALAGMAFSSCDEKQLKTQPGVPFIPAIDPVRVAVVGVGMQGSGHVQSLLQLEGVELRAVCDLVEDKIKRMQSWAREAGKPEPKGYFKGELDFKRMCDQEDLDLVITATPWEWHVPVCVKAMTTGSHAATEVPAAVTIDECWQLVETAEQTRKHCMMLENVCYMAPELLILNMVRKGVFGELLHAEGAYNHDLRNYLLGSLYENDWRIKHCMTRNGNLYPTHGLGPIAQCLNINRGDRFDFLVSMSTPSLGLKEYALEKLGADHHYSKTAYSCGDVNTSLIRTAMGRTITLVHDTHLPRPYSRINLIQGTQGITQGFSDMTHGSLIHIEGRSEPHWWEPLSNYETEFEHPLIQEASSLAEGGGHGGADFIEIYRLIHCLRNGLPTDQDVYDAVDWSVVSGLTELSVANRSKPVDFPDFTRGLWKTRKPQGIIAEDQS